MNNGFYFTQTIEVIKYDPVCLRRILTDERKHLLQNNRRSVWTDEMFPFQLIKVLTGTQDVSDFINDRTETVFY